MGDSSEDVARMSSSTFNAIPMVDTALSSLGIDIEELQVVVEINRAGTEIPSQESGMGREDGRNINPSLLGKG